MRLGQQNPSLAALASGRWPMYLAQDNLPGRNVAEANPTSRDSETTHAGH